VPAELAVMNPELAYELAELAERSVRTDNDIFLVVGVPVSKSTTKNIVFCVLADGAERKFKLLIVTLVLTVELAVFAVENALFA
jgi:hypothetical protein